MKPEESPTPKPVTPHPFADHDDHRIIRKFVTTSWTELEAKYREAALYLIGACGVFAATDPDALHKAIERLADPKAERKRKAWFHKHFTGDGHGHELVFAGDRAQAVQAIWDVTDLDLDVETANRESAYLLGVAVGRLMGGAR